MSFRDPGLEFQRSRLEFQRSRLEFQRSRLEVQRTMLEFQISRLEVVQRNPGIEQVVTQIVFAVLLEDATSSMDRNQDLPANIQR